MTGEGTNETLFWRCIAQIQRHYLDLTKAQRLRVERWIDRLVFSSATAAGCSGNATWRRHRLAYARLLLHMVVRRQFGAPFHVNPPDGALPSFPSHALAGATSAAILSQTHASMKQMEEAERAASKAATPIAGGRQRPKHAVMGINGAVRELVGLHEMEFWERIFARRDIEFTDASVIGKENSDLHLKKKESGSSIKRKEEKSNVSNVGRWDNELAAERRHGDPPVGQQLPPPPPGSVTPSAIAAYNSYARELSSLNMVIRDQHERIALLEAQLREERIKHELQLQRIHWQKSVELRASASMDASVLRGSVDGGSPRISYNGTGVFGIGTGLRSSIGFGPGSTVQRSMDPDLSHNQVPPGLNECQLFGNSFSSGRQVTSPPRSSTPTLQRSTSPMVNRYRQTSNSGENVSKSQENGSVWTTGSYDLIGAATSKNDTKTNTILEENPPQNARLFDSVHSIVSDNELATRDGGGTPSTQFPAYPFPAVLTTSSVDTRHSPLPPRYSAVEASGEIPQDFSVPLPPQHTSSIADIGEKDILSQNPTTPFLETPVIGAPSFETISPDNLESYLQSLDGLENSLRSWTPAF